MKATYEEMEALCKARSKQGVRIRLAEDTEGWHWHVTLNGLPGILSNGSTTARTKAVAFAMALGLI